MTKKICVLLFFLVAFFFFTPKINSAIAACPYPYWSGSSVNCANYCFNPYNGQGFCNYSPPPPPRTCQYSYTCGSCSQSCGGGTQLCTVIYTNCNSTYAYNSCNTQPCAPSAPPQCPGSGIPSSGPAWGSSCSPGTTQQKYACDGPSHCSITDCSFYASNAAGSTYCWYNSGACYNDPAACNEVNPPPSCPNNNQNPSSGWGGSCPSLNDQKKLTCGGAGNCSVANCQTYSNGSRCWYNSGQCYNDPAGCASVYNSYTQEIQTCQSTGWVTIGTACVSSCTPATPIPTPTPTPRPNCTTGPPSCGSCRSACGQGNSRTCYLTGPGNCTPVAYNDTSGCATNCPNNFNCVSNSCVPAGSISGHVFLDANKNRVKDGTEIDYPGTITITSTGGTVTTGAGIFAVNNLTAGQYTITYSNIPADYQLTYPIPPIFASLSVGIGTCSTGTSNSARCDASGNITDLNYGITNSNPWMQCTSGDCRVDLGFSSKIPSTAIGGAYASLNGSGGTPGLIFTGNSNADFGQGQASSTGWVVGGASSILSETYSPTKMGGQVKTSYDFLLSKATAGNIVPTKISTLSAGLPRGIYQIDGDLNLTGGGYTFGANQNYVILVKGNLTISERITVPNGSTAIFSTTGNITVYKTLGETASDSTTMTIQGIYSAGKSFIADGNNSCSIGPDPRLNIAGSVIVNGAQGGGSFQNLRDLCGNDLYYPSVSFFERADFALNSPEFLKQPNFTYQEVAP